MFYDKQSCETRTLSLSTRLEICEITHNRRGIIRCASCTKPVAFLCSRLFSYEGMSTGAGDGGGGGVGGVQSSGGGRNTPPHGSPTPMDKATLKVHLPNGELTRYGRTQVEESLLRA